MLLMLHWNHFIQTAPTLWKFRNIYIVRCIFEVGEFLLYTFNCWYIYYSLLKFWSFYQTSFLEKGKDCLLSSCKVVESHVVCTQTCVYLLETFVWHLINFRNQWPFITLGRYHEEKVSQLWMVHQTFAYLENMQCGINLEDIPSTVFWNHIKLWLP